MSKTYILQLKNTLLLKDVSHHASLFAGGGFCPGDVKDHRPPVTITITVIIMKKFGIS